MTDDEIYSLQVVKSNKMVQKGKYNLTTQELRIINYLIANIKPNDTDFKTMIFDINHFTKLCGIKGKTIEYLRRTIYNLYNKSWEVKIDNYYTAVRWIDKYKIYPNKSTVEITLDKELLPFLIELKQNFTTAELYIYLSFTCKYSYLIYDYLKSYVNMKYKLKQESYTVNMTIAELKEKLCVPQSKYKHFNDFKKNVINSFVLDINTKSDIEISYQLVRSGREVAAIQFLICDKELLHKIQTKEKQINSLKE